MKVRTFRPRRTATPSSTSTQLISRKGRLELPGELLYGVQAPFDNVGRRETSPVASENQYYTVKYVGITNGELGVLSQRKPLLSPKGQFRYPAPLTPQPQPTDPVLPAEFLKPNPTKYNEFIVHQYSRPRPLTASKRERGTISPMSWLLEGAKCGISGQDAVPAKVERKGVAGWKLAWPRSHSSFACRTKHKPAAVQAAKQEDSQNYVFGEAYLHYLHQLRQAKS